MVETLTKPSRSNKYMRSMLRPTIEAFFEEQSKTISYVVSDMTTRRCAVIDPVLDFNYRDGHTSTTSADLIVDYIQKNDLTVDWILETHVHADHLSAAQYMKLQVDGKVAIGAYVTEVQAIFKGIFNESNDFHIDGSQFDYLLENAEQISIGDLVVKVMHTPGHTPACVTYVIGDVAFVGDTLFMPDYGTARTDFPGGDARILYRSIQRIFALPAKTRLYKCHDYLSGDRTDYFWESTVAEQRCDNVHIGAGVTEDDFVAMREEKNKMLSKPRYLLPAIQVNMRAGHLPPYDTNGVSYLKIPLNLI